MNDSTKTTLTLNVGDLEVTSSIIYNQDMFVKNCEIYKDLLALTSISKKIDMIIHFSKQPKISFQDFLKLKLGFSLLRVEADVNSV
jgi:hypothetical protein